MKLFIVDDHQMMQLGIKTWIENNTEHKVIGTAGNIENAISMINKLEAENNLDLVIVDVDLGEENGLDLVKTIRKQKSNIKVLVYSMHKKTGYLLDAKSSGANGYVAKDAEMDDFKVCLDKLASGNDCFDFSVDEKSQKLQETFDLLTPKEKLVFQEILKEENNETIAKHLGVSTHSVEIYVSRIYDKLGVHFRNDLIAKFQ